jgi:hypothetical protein
LLSSQGALERVRGPANGLSFRSDFRVHHGNMLGNK